MFSIKDKVIVVTGGTGILGHAFVDGICEAGGTAVIIGRNEEIGEQQVKRLQERSQKALFVKADVLQAVDLKNAADLILEKTGKIDGLVNAAGGNIPEAVLEPDDDVFDIKISALREAFDLNLFGTIMPTLLFGQHIAKQKGSIINISSMAARSAITRVLGYSMAKAGVDNFTRWMAVELANRYGDNLRINAIAPGFFITKQNKKLLTNDDGSFTSRGEMVIRNTPFRRFGEPEELVGTLLWLLSDASAFVNGDIICVDGGFHVFSGV